MAVSGKKFDFFCLLSRRRVKNKGFLKVGNCFPSGEIPRKRNSTFGFWHCDICDAKGRDSTGLAGLKGEEFPLQGTSDYM